MIASLSKQSRAALAAAFLLMGSLCAVRADPDAGEILRQARMAQMGRQERLEGHLRVQATGEVIPFTLVLGGDKIRYEFKDQEILLRLGAGGSQLMESAHGDMRKVAPARYDKAVEGTDITNEDVSLSFLYWPVARIDGSESVDALNCWKLRLGPGAQASAYASVELWVRKADGTFLKGEGYDAAGKLVKRFKVVSGQPDPRGGWMLKKMRIETLREGKDESITYLEIDQ